jgi:LPXTG-motif cell wall-anchored protein
MASGVGAHAARVRAVIAAVIVGATVSVFASQAGAQAAPGIDVDKIELGGIAPATFVVTGVDVDFRSELTANVPAENTPTPALPSPAGLAPGEYQIQETAPIDPTGNGNSQWVLTSIACDSGNQRRIDDSTIQITVTDSVVTCTFTDTFVPGAGRPFPGEPGGATTTTPGGGTTTTTIAGGSTTTTAVASTTTTLVVVQTLPVIPETPPTTAPSSGSTTAPELPTTGSPTGGLLVAALVAMLAGVALVARTRRFVD